MNADGLSGDCDSGSIAGGYAALLSDGQGLAAGFYRVADQGIIVFSGAQRSVRFVATVSEGLGREREASAAENIKHWRTSQADKHDIASPSDHAICDRLSKLAIMHSLIVKSAVRLDVSELHATLPGDFCESSDLLVHGVGYRFQREVV